MEEPRIPISEIFGPTLQGEGVFSGVRAVFVRVAGCDSNCSWCDTKYARDPDSGKEMTTREIFDDVVSRMPAGLVVLTGGNPALYDLGALVAALNARGFTIHIETQGTVIPYWFDRVGLVTICPKIFSGDDIPNIISAISSATTLTMVQLKFVIFHEADYADARELAQKFKGLPFVFQPGYDCEKKCYPFGFRELADRVAEDNELPRTVRFMPQLHRIIWGDARGV